MKDDEYNINDIVEYPDPRSNGKKIGWVHEIRGSIVFVLSHGYKMPLGYYASQLKKVAK